MIAINPPLRFGKHKGTPVSDVPTQYLTWVIETFPRPPDYVVAEVVRRGSTHFGGDAILCQAALSEKAFGQSRKAKKKWSRSVKRSQRRASRGEVSRQKSKEVDARIEKGVRIVGEHFEKLRKEFIESGGDVNSCPF